jgi:2-keto-4-pentenoate hydratase/2-oxohepta-3-ene-1,7-dioic acid hydratase in catechol pathway
VETVKVARLRHQGEGGGAWFSIDGALATRFTGAPWLGGELTSDRRPFSPGDLLAPVAPSKIVCVGRNYAAHAKELGNDVPESPLLFLKPPSALLDPGGDIVLPADSVRVEHEAELGVVVGTRCRHVSEGDALRHVFGYTCVGDITARDLQRKDVQFTRAKGFDTFCPVGPWIETDLDPAALRVSCTVSGVLRQDGNTRDMIFPVPRLLAFVSRVMTLEPGDLLVTGTPEGVGPLVAGHLLTIEVAGVGALSVSVRAAS